MALIKKDDVTTPGSSTTSGPPHTILGPEASFDGKLTFKGQVRIDGRFSGEIETEDVCVIGKDAQVTAALNVGSLVLHGTLRGNVRAKRSIELHPPAKLYGDVEVPNLSIHNGVIFEGTCRMENLGAKPKVLTNEQPSAQKPADGKQDQPKK